MGAQQSNANQCENKSERKSPKKDKSADEIGGKNLPANGIVSLPVQANLPFGSSQDPMLFNKNPKSETCSPTQSPETSASNRSVEVKDKEKVVKSEKTDNYLEALSRGDNISDASECQREPMSFNKNPKSETCSPTQSPETPASTRSVEIEGIEKVVKSEKTDNYLEALFRSDKFHSENKEKRVCWLLARFLANEEIASKIVQKYRDLGQGVERPQKMISYFLRLSFDNLSPKEVSFLLSEEHRTFKGLRIPYEIQSLKCFITKSKNFAKAVRDADKDEADDVVRHGRRATVNPVDEKLGDVASNTKNIPRNVKVELAPPKVVERIEFQCLINSLELNSTSTESSILRANWEPGARPWSLTSLDDVLGSRRNLKPPNGKIWEFIGPSTGGEMCFAMQPMFHAQRLPVTDLAAFLRDKPLGCSSADVFSCWPWNANCEELLHSIRCLIHINTTLKNGIARSDIQEEEIGKKTRGKRVRRGNPKSSEVVAGSSEESIKPARRHNTNEAQTDGEMRPVPCDHLGCHVLHEEITKEIVSGVCKIRTIFPFFDGKSETFNFLLDEVPTMEAHELFPNILECDCSMNMKTNKTGTSSFASITFSPGQRHFHDTLLVDLILPKYEKEESWRFVPVDTVHLLNILSRYVCEVHVQSMAVVRKRTPDNVLVDHLRDVQSMCEHVFCFIIFSEVCGPAESTMAGGYYLTSARNHYEKAFNSAIETGIFPTFVNFLNTEMYRFLRTMRIVKTLSRYTAALSFLDLRLLDMTSSSPLNVTKYAKDDLRIEPTAVSMLEPILGEGYQHAIDDETAYKALSGQVDPRTMSDGIAIVSPIFDSRCPEEASFRLYGFEDSIYTSYSTRSEMRKHIEQETKTVQNDLAKTYAKVFPNKVKNFPEDVTLDTSGAEVDDQLLYEQLYEFFDDLQTAAEREIDESSEELNDLTADAVNIEPDGSYSEESMLLKNTRTGVSSGMASNTRERLSISKHRRHSKNAIISGVNAGESKENDGMKNEVNNAETCGRAPAPENDASDSSKAKRRKANRDYLSPEKRQQRQAQRLREKWEQKHKSDDNSAQQTESNCGQ